MIRKLNNSFYLGVLLFVAWSILMLGLASCKKGENPDPTPIDPVDTAEVMDEFRLGGDFSYVNEMLDCGATYLTEQNSPGDPYEIFSEAGCKWARFRLWHNPDWTDYSDAEDVSKAISRAKEVGMKVLLDFHYSDDWADPGSQEVPAAWTGVVNNTPLLGDSVYNYTYKTLARLHGAGILPEMVQLGNETNSEVMQDPNGSYSRINWGRNASLLNRAIDAVRDFSDDSGEKVEIMFHIAQPENAIWWFDEAENAGLKDYDWIGISYYPAWSSYALSQVSSAIQDLINAHKKEVMVVETAYPFTMENQDGANNILGQDALVSGYPATETGQYEFLKALKAEIIEGGGAGMFYWEPAWVSTSCSTRWGQGSHWDNAAFFDEDGKTNEAMRLFGD